MRPSVYALEKRLSLLLEAHEKEGTLPCLSIEEQAEWLLKYADVICPEHPAPYEVILDHLQSREQTGTRDILLKYADVIEEAQSIPAGEMGEHDLSPAIETPICEGNYTETREVTPDEHPAPLQGTDPVKLPRYEDPSLFRNRAEMARRESRGSPFSIPWESVF